MATDWAHIRTYRMSTERPDEWPHGVKGISQQGLALLGIQESNGRLYWDGKALVTRTFQLGTVERWIGSFAAIGTFGTFLVQAGRSFGFWP